MKSRARLRAMVHCRARYETCPGKPPPDAREATPESCLRQTVDQWGEIGDDGAERYGVDPSVLQAVDAGAIDYDEGAADTCLETFRQYVDQLTCIQARRLESLIVRGIIERDLIPACSKVFTPKHEEGDTCETDRECKGRLVCGRKDDESGACGTCRAPDGSGNSGPPTFSYALKGESCASPNHTPTCDPRKAVLCESTESGRWTCQPEMSKGEGKSCHSFGICKEGLVCRDGTCKPFDVVEAGETCGTADVFCERPLVCRASGEGSRVCDEIGRAGDACRSDGECAGELWCGPPDRGHDESGQCQGPIQEGHDCERGRCAEGLYCPRDFQPNGGTCQPVKGEGERCNSQRDCKSGLRCRWDRNERHNVCQSRDGGDEDSKPPLDECRP